MWPKAAVYLYVISVTKLRAHRLNNRGDLADWERDDTSRNAAGGATLSAAEKPPVK